MTGVAREGRHRPVLLEQAIAGLKIVADGVYVDGTFGRGGHSKEILKHLGSHGRLIAIDKDPAAVAAAHELAAKDPRFVIRSGSFADVARILAALEIQNGVQGVLLDLGVSSPQLDTPERGFSFLHEGPLDMRFDPSRGEPAAQWLSRIDEQELKRVLKEYGEERYSGRIAKAIVSHAKNKGFRSTSELADLVASVVPAREKRKHPATRTFQAIRIAINNELEDLKRFLQDIPEVLAVGGRLVVISFHSLEDRIVKHFIRRHYRGPEDRMPPGLPVRTQPFLPRLKPVGKIIRPQADELEANPRARSAVLRIAERLR